MKGGNHGKAWKLAYADLVTAMMAFFLLMWLINMVPTNKKVKIAGYFKEFSIVKIRAMPGTCVLAKARHSA